MLLKSNTARIVQQSTKSSFVRQYSLVEKVLSYDPGEAEEELLNRAYVFSMRAHGQQFRASGDPYFNHPLEVANILANMRLDHTTIITALLHDVIEDTPTTLEEITEMFGPEIAFLVDGVTKLSSIDSANKEQSQVENYRKLFLAMAKDVRILLVKLADRVHNMRTLQFLQSDIKRERIAKETMEIYAPLAARMGVTPLQNELENLAFQHLYPNGYNELKILIDNLPFNQQTFEKINDDLSKTLNENGISAYILGREKTPYSIWKKMQEKEVSFEQLADVMAFRIIVEDRTDCYRALGAIHNAYVVVPGQFKDYISSPKKNGYQSLHTTLIGPYNYRIEVQIRTKKMNHFANFGVAAHWQYKQKAKIDKKEDQQYQWLQGLLSVVEHAESPAEFLEHTKLAMFPDQVFCFTPKGKIIKLPKKATALDFAFHLHSNIGEATHQVKINGKTVPLWTKIVNGDVVEIITDKSVEPLSSWLTFVVSAKAKADIRRHLRQQKTIRAIKLGKSLLKTAFEPDGFVEEKLQNMLDSKVYKTLDDLYHEIGAGNCNASQVIALYHSNGKQKLVAKSVNNTLNDGKKTSPIVGAKQEHIITFAKCCYPVPGDSVVAILKDGEFQIHRFESCPNINKIHNPELINVGWNANFQDKYHAKVRCLFSGHEKILGFIISTMHGSGIELDDIKFLKREPSTWEVDLRIFVQDNSHIESFLASLNINENIKSAKRL